MFASPPQISLRFMGGYMTSPAAQAAAPTPLSLWLPYRIQQLGSNTLIPHYLLTG